MLLTYLTNLGNKEHQKSKQDCLEAITVLRGDLEATMKLENSRVYVEISAKYQEDLEVVNSNKCQIPCFEVGKPLDLTCSHMYISRITRLVKGSA